MTRTELIQTILQSTDFQKYLEIGVQDGHNFFPIKARKKIAVDPSINFSFKRKIKRIWKNPSNLMNKYFEQESDTFFQRNKKYLDRSGKLDLVFIDGLHTFNASLNDVLNSLHHLNSNGVIVMHDCLPPYAAAALPTKNVPTEEDLVGVEGYNGTWCGDVWKTILYLRRKLDWALDISVIDSDFGLGIIIPKKEIDPKHLVIDRVIFDEINALDYDFLMKDNVSLLNLKPIDHINAVINKLKNK